MTTFTKIGIDTLLLYINSAFRDDDKLFNTYHIHPGSFHDCAVDTYNTITEVAQTYPETVIFGIKQNDEKIGFITMLPSSSILHSFGININFRIPGIKGAFIEFVNKYLNNKTTVLLYTKNTRAINYFKRNSFIEDIDFLPNNEKVTKLYLCQ